LTPLDRKVADLEGLPRRNGELVFEAPWQGRAFGLAVAMNEQGAYEWEEFRRHLADEIGRAPECEFYASWIGALERLLSDEGVLDRSELEGRKAEYLLMKRDEAF
jgi:nitrile hydratase accessory protein